MHIRSICVRVSESVQTSEITIRTVSVSVRIADIRKMSIR